MVSLRQIQHKAAREKERNQELRRLQDEARKEEGQRLARRVQELERDKNLMLVGDWGSWDLVAGVSKVIGGGGGPRAPVRLTLSFPGHLEAGGSPLPLQAAASVSRASLGNG